MSTPLMASGAKQPVWPLPDVTRKRWTFGASRADGSRRHAGVDLYARRGSAVLSPERGRVVAWQPFNGPKAHALLIQLDSGPVVLMGEVEPGSWARYGLGIGSRVQAGQPVADVGINPGGSQMLHLEMYTEGTRKNQRWYTGQNPPAALLNPTEYLKSAVSLDIDPVDPQDDPIPDIHPQDDPIPDIHPLDPVDPPMSRGGGAVLGLGLVFLIASALGDKR